MVSSCSLNQGQYSRVSVDTVGCGLCGENAHGANEAVHVADLVTQAKIYVETITRLLGAA